MMLGHAVACAALPFVILHSVGNLRSGTLRRGRSGSPRDFVASMDPLGLDAVARGQTIHPVVAIAFVARERSARFPTGAVDQPALTRLGILHTKEAPARVGSDGRGLRANLSSRCVLRWTRIGGALGLRSPAVMFN